MSARHVHGSGILDAELLWYFNEAAGEMGIRAMPLEPSIQHDNDGEPTERQIEAAGRHRRISSALFSLPHQHQRTLRLAHELLPVALRPALQKLGELAAVVLSLPGVDGADVVARLAHRGADETARVLRDRAARVVAVALGEYREARRTVGALERTTRQVRHDAFMSRLRDGRGTAGGAAVYLEAERMAPAARRPKTALVDRPGRAGLWPLAKGRCG